MHNSLRGGSPNEAMIVRRGGSWGCVCFCDAWMWTPQPSKVPSCVNIFYKPTHHAENCAVPIQCTLSLHIFSFTEGGCAQICALHGLVRLQQPSCLRPVQPKPPKFWATPAKSTDERQFKSRIFFLRVLGFETRNHGCYRSEIRFGTGGCYLTLVSASIME